VAKPPEQNSPDKAPEKDPAKPDASTDAFVREVDDAVRQDSASRFFARYGKATIAIVVAGLLGYGGWLYYSASQTEVKGAQGSSLIEMLDSADANNAGAANTAADKLLKDATPTYKAATLMAKGNIALATDPKKAIGFFAQVAADANAPADLRSLALLRQTMAEMDSLKPDVVLTRMKPLMGKGTTWSATATELSAIASMKLGKNAEAQALYSSIANSKDAPESLKSRASQMASMLSGAASTEKSVPISNSAIPAQTAKETSK
jgi:hypothetical protein